MPDIPKVDALPGLEGEPYLVFDALEKLMHELLEEESIDWESHIGHSTCVSDLPPSRDELSGPPPGGDFNVRTRHEAPLVGWQRGTGLLPGSHRGAGARQPRGPF